MADAYGGHVFIADSSAWNRASSPAVADEWRRAARSGQIATCPIVTLELVYSTRDGAGFDALAVELAQLRDVPISRSVTNAALRAYRELAYRQPLFHRSVSVSDVLIAAAAADAGLGVLHYDADYDTLAEVLSFESRWIAPPGSLD